MDSVKAYSILAHKWIARVTMSGSTLASRALGRQLVKFRERAGLSEYAVAKAAETSPQTYGRLEDGLKHNVTNMMINAICDKLRVSDSERRLLLGLAEEVRKERKSEGKWWRPYIDETQTSLDHYLNLEQHARRLTTLQIAIVPGMLQTSEYRRQLAWARNPQWTPEEVERRVELAAFRQERLADPRFKFDAFLSEMILRQQTGGPGVMEDQLRHLLEVGELRNVSIRIVPFSATNPIALLANSFVYLEFGPLPSSKLIEPPVAFVEGHTGCLYLEKENELAMYQDAIVRIRRVALEPSASRNLILAVAREYSE
ncbi:helix-turn-helix domain-containing protein [Nocardia transvalensis]|uniref:helix-turn-helix domain-containing protein n=1 Tax=Nocardia transvalensis TaxID=37333 RepID=UPI001893849D|nr:helix-turn-helix transcriptional regulator [Nocardia transvalensis]MBF6332033.1 helix-turn-helix domain-containing protein [Nocardia transvalensis]